MAIPNNKPLMAIQGNTLPVRITAANTASDGSGTLGTNIFQLLESSATGAGTTITGVVFTSAQSTNAASAARVCRIFLTDAAGSNPGLVGEVALASGTRSNTVVGPTNTFWFARPLALRPGQKLLVSQSIRVTAADDTDVYALAGDYAQDA